MPYMPCWLWLGCLDRSCTLTIAHSHRHAPLASVTQSRAQQHLAPAQTTNPNFPLVSVTFWHWPWWAAQVELSAAARDLKASWDGLGKYTEFYPPCIGRISSNTISSMWFVLSTNKWKTSCVVFCWPLICPTCSNIRSLWGLILTHLHVGIYSYIIN